MSAFRFWRGGAQLFNSGRHIQTMTALFQSVDASLLKYKDTGQYRSWEKKEKVRIQDQAVKILLVLPNTKPEYLVSIQGADHLQALAMSFTIMLFSSPYTLPYSTVPLGHFSTPKSEKSGTSPG